MSPGARIPIKLHKQVMVIETTDPILARELEAHKPLARLVAGRLGDSLLLVRPEEGEAALEELKRIGHVPRVVR